MVSLRWRMVQDSGSLSTWEVPSGKPRLSRKSEAADCFLLPRKEPARMKLERLGVFLKPPHFGERGPANDDADEEEEEEEDRVMEGKIQWKKGGAECLGRGERRGWSPSRGGKEKWASSSSSEVSSESLREGTIFQKKYSS